MTSDGFIPFGYVAKTHGLKGELKIIIQQPDLLQGDSADFFYLGISEPPVPYLIQSCKLTKPKEMILKFEELQSVEEAALMVGKKIFIAVADLPEGHHEPDQELEGYTLFDQNGKKLGPIIEILDMPAHRVVVIEISGQEVLIPLIETSIKNLDHQAKTLQLDIPDGLIEVYTSS